MPAQVSSLKSIPPRSQRVSASHNPYLRPPRRITQQPSRSQPGLLKRIARFVFGSSEVTMPTEPSKPAIAADTHANSNSPSKQKPLLLSPPFEQQPIPIWSKKGFNDSISHNPFNVESNGEDTCVKTQNGSEAMAARTLIPNFSPPTSNGQKFTIPIPDFTPDRPAHKPRFVGITNTSTPKLNISIVPADESELRQVLAMVPPLSKFQGRSSTSKSHPGPNSISRQRRKQRMASTLPYAVARRSNAFKEVSGTATLPSSSPLSLSLTPKSILKKAKDSKQSSKTITPLRFGLYNQTIEIPDRFTERAMRISPPIDVTLGPSSPGSDRSENDEWNVEVRKRLEQAAVNTKSNSAPPRRSASIPIIEAPRPRRVHKSARRIRTQRRSESEIPNFLTQSSPVELTTTGMSPTSMTTEMNPVMTTMPSEMRSMTTTEQTVMSPLMLARRVRAKAKKEWDDLRKEEEDVFGPNASFAPDYEEKVKRYYAKRGITHYKLDNVSNNDHILLNEQDRKSGTYGLSDSDLEE